MDSTAGATVSNGLLLAKNQCWAQPVVSKGNPYTSTADYVAFWNKQCFTDHPKLQLARICYKFAYEGWRYATQQGELYPGTTGGWADQVNDLRAIPVLSSQKLDAVVALGTNDAHEYDIGTLFGSPTQGSPNLVTNCLVPLVQLLRNNGVRRIGVVTPIARWEGGGTINDQHNQAFSDFADYTIVPANMMAIGVNAVWDSRSDSALDCRNYKAVTLNTAVYQTDRVHLTANGYVNHLGPPMTRMLDQFWSA